MPSSALYKIHFISESAATIDFGNVVDENINKKIIALFHYLYDHPMPGMIEAIPAYASLSVYFNLGCLRKKISPGKKIFEWINDELHKLMQNELAIDEIVVVLSDRDLFLDLGQRFLDHSLLLLMSRRGIAAVASCYD